MEIRKTRLHNFAYSWNLICSTLTDVLINMIKSDIKITAELQQALCETGYDL